MIHRLENYTPGVLLIEDDPAQALLISRWLTTHTGLTVRHAPDGESGELLLRSSGNWQIVISDIELPGQSGLSLLRMSKRLHPLTPTLLITAHEKPDYLLQALRGRADDVLIKPLRSETLVDRVRQLIDSAELKRRRRQRVEMQRSQYREMAEANTRITQLLTRSLERTAELNRQSREDPLTGIANRRELDARFAVEFGRSRRFGRPLTVAMIDVDHFKRLNDRYSHQTGDEVLRRIAAVLRETSRSIDVVGRYGGEEFMVVLVETPCEAAAVWYERLSRRLADEPWRELGVGLDVTLSVGFASLADDDTPEGVVARADAQLYAAKESGRDRACGLPCLVAG
jgi:diguanylate cyclase (GGDEF)-like protein